MARWGKVDFKELKKFQDRMNKIEKRSDEISEAVVKELAKRMLAKVVKRTPTGQYPAGSGKTGGTLKRGWRIGSVVKTSYGYEVEVYNPVAYSMYVEYGHRTSNHAGWVPGRFMMTISAKEIDDKSKQIAERIVEKKLREAFKK